MQGSDHLIDIALGSKETRDHLLVPLRIVGRGTIKLGRVTGVGCGQRDRAKDVEHFLDPTAEALLDRCRDAGPCRSITAAHGDIGPGASVGQLPFQIMDVERLLAESRVIHDALLKRDVGVDAVDHHFSKRAAHALQCLLAGLAISDDFRYQ